MNYTDKEHRIKITTSLVSCYHKLYKSHSWLWAQQTQAIDSHCFNMQLLTTTFLFRKVKSPSCSDQSDLNAPDVVIMTRQLVSTNAPGGLERSITLSGADVRARSVGIDSYTYWGLYRFFSKTFPQTMKLNHRQCPWLRWRKFIETPMFVSNFMTIMHTPFNFVLTIHKYLQQLQQVISNGGGPQLLTQGCVYRAASQMGGTFPPQWREQRENLKRLILRDCL